MASISHRILLVCLGASFFLGLIVAADDSPTGHNIVSPTDTIVAIKATTKGAANHLAEAGDFGELSGNEELAVNAIDGDLNTKYFNKAQNNAGSAGIDTGFVVTPHVGSTVVTGIQFATAGDVPDRDPLAITIEGSNAPDADKAKGNGFTLIYRGQSGLTKDPGRNIWGQVVAFTNTQSYKTYRVLITQVRSDGADATQFSEVKLLGVPAQ
jgi:hypothetical protein